MGKRRVVYRFLVWGNLRDGEHLEDEGGDGSVILKIDL